jgi:hypothetical protein
MKIIRFFAWLFFISLSIVYLSVPLLAHAPGGRMFFYVQEKRPYFPQHSEESAKVFYIKYKLAEYVKFPAYKKRGRITFCNVFARDILDCRTKKRKTYCFYFNDFYYDISPVFPKLNSIYINIPRAYKRANKAAAKNRIVLHSMRQAQRQANQGKLIWGISAKYNHEFIVFPGEWSKEKGCWIAQAGDKNGIFRISDKAVFGKNWKDSEIRFYEFEEVNIKVRKKLDKK